jgi:hypothetical protein
MAGVGAVNIDVGGITQGLFKLVDDLFTSDEERDAAKLKLLSQQGQQSLAELQTTLSAILAEANSKDKWTSRARPSFLYIMYAMILASIPMGVLHVVDPVSAAAVAEGMKSWLAALPEPLWWLFGSGYLGYTGARTFDKSQLLKLKGK